MAKTPLKLVIEQPMSYLERAEKAFIPTGGQSLVESIRRDLPDDEGPDHLVYIVTRQQAIYMTLLGKLIAGSSFKAAAMSIGLSPQKVYGWLSQGSTDLSDDSDTFCARFLLDCQRAQSMAVGDAEERVHQANPDRWLGKGSAKEFHKGRYWVDQIQQRQDDPSLPPVDEAPDTFEPAPTRQIAQVDDDPENNGEKELQEALRVLETHNIINNPEFVKQAREQYRLPKPDEQK